MPSKRLATLQTAVPTTCLECAQHVRSIGVRHSKSMTIGSPMPCADGDHFPCIVQAFVRKQSGRKLSDVIPFCQRGRKAKRGKITATQKEKFKGKIGKSKFVRHVQ